jgi:putative Holliday junction resolvase
MPVMDLAAFHACLPVDLPLVGLDVGTKTIGIALSDVTRCIATPYETVRRGRFRDDAARLGGIVETNDVAGMVVGLPVSMDGREGPRCQSVRQFAANLLAVIDRPLLLWDERLSTVAVERFLIEQADLSRARRRQVIDRAAAAYILQGALDALARIGRPAER